MLPCCAAFTGGAVAVVSGGQKSSMSVDDNIFEENMVRMMRYVMQIVYFTRNVMHRDSKAKYRLGARGYH